MPEAGCKDFLVWPQGWKGSPYIFRELLKMDVTLKWGMGMCGICGRKQKIFGLCNLKFGQAMRNLACGDQ